MSTQEMPFPEVPAPWNCKGEALWFLGYINPSKGSYPSLSSFSDLEGSSTFADSKVTGEYKGGLTSLMIVRYKETPIGPYDEIIWCPGAFIVPQTGKAVKRITRIYVSTKESVYNGRKNWNVPKHQAHFEFTPNPKISTPDDLPYSKVSISSIPDPEHPFFVVDLTPTRFLSRAWVPFKSSNLPVSGYLTLPPLPQSPKWREDALVGSDHWCGVDLFMKGKGGLFWAKGGLEGGKYGDDVLFPDVRPWSMGMWLKDFELEFPVSEEPGKKKSD